MVRKETRQILFKKVSFVAAIGCQRSRSGVDSLAGTNLGQGNLEVSLRHSEGQRLRRDSDVLSGRRHRGPTTTDMTSNVTTDLHDNQHHGNGSQGDIS